MPDNHKEVRIERRSMSSVVDTDGEDQEHDNVVEECDKIEGKESNIQLKPQRYFENLSDDTVCSVNRFIMKYQDDKQTDKELEWVAICDTDSVNLMEYTLSLMLSRRKILNRILMMIILRRCVLSIYLRA